MAIDLAEQRFMLGITKSNRWIPHGVALIRWVFEQTLEREIHEEWGREKLKRSEPVLLTIQK
jgi:hypothetical protein